MVNNTKKDRIRQTVKINEFNQIQDQFIKIMIAFWPFG